MPGSPDGSLKTFLDGTHRAVSPAETLGRVSRFFPGFGITRVANITGLDHVGVPTVIVCRPNSRSLAVSQGKGVDLLSAKASGVMESVEQYHAERISLPLRLGSFNELRHVCHTLPGERLPLSTVSRYDAGLRLLWVEGYDIIKQCATLIPYELVHLNFTLPLPEGSGCFPLSSNGLASGNHLLEAIVHGACEVIERDAVTLWELGDEAARAATRLDPGSVDDPLCQAVLERYTHADLLSAIWDITSDVGIPAFRCTIADRTPDPFRPLYAATGTGCHPAREVALLRALTEAAQGRLTVIAGSRDDIPRTDYAVALDAEAVRQLSVDLMSEPPVRRFIDAPTGSHESFERDIEWIVERLRRVGLDSLIVVDLSMPGLGIAVVRVVVPGLEQQRMGLDYAPGPRALGRMRSAGSQP